MQKPIKLHWSASKPNFGDALSPLICEAVSGRKVIYETIKKCDLVAVGSLLQRLPEHLFSRRLNIWGSGFIANEKPHRSRHHYHAIRGKLSRDIVRKHKDLPLGDPGLLADLLVSDTAPVKQCAVGLIAHYKDKSNPLLQAICDQNPQVSLIDIFLPPMTFLQRLQNCEVIFSSAMHGLIAADALGIANARIKLSSDVRGGDFKFADYYSVFDLPATSIEITPENILHQANWLVDNYQRPGLSNIKQQLLDSFPTI